MATKKGNPKGKPVPAAPMARVEGLLAQLLLHSLGESANQRKKALALSMAGLTNSEIAPLMGVSAEHVGQLLYQARKIGTKKKRPAKKK